MHNARCDKGHVTARELLLRDAYSPYFALIWRWGVGRHVGCGAWGLVLLLYFSFFVNFLVSFFPQRSACLH